MPEESEIVKSEKIVCTLSPIARRQGAQRLGRMRSHGAKVRRVYVCLPLYSLYSSPTDQTTIPPLTKATRAVAQTVASLSFNRISNHTARPVHTQTKKLTVATYSMSPTLLLVLISPPSGQKTPRFYSCFGVLSMMSSAWSTTSIIFFRKSLLVTSKFCSTK